MSSSTPHALRFAGPALLLAFAPVNAFAATVELLSADRFVDIRFDVSALEAGVATNGAPNERIEAQGFEDFEASVLNAVSVDPAANPTGLGLSGNARASQTSSLQVSDSGAVLSAAASVLGGSDPAPGLAIPSAARSEFAVSFSVDADTDFELSGTGGGENSEFGLAAFSIALTDTGSQNRLPATFPVAAGGDPTLPRFDLAATGRLEAGSYTFTATAFSELLGFADFDFVLELAAASSLDTVTGPIAAVPSPTAAAGGFALLAIGLARRSRESRQSR